MKFSLLIIMIGIFLVFGCGNVQKISIETNCGKLSNYLTEFETETGKFSADSAMGDHLIWFKDSFVIQACMEINIESENGGPETRTAYPFQYTFIDLRTKSFYDYGTFSDTATLLQKYSQSDSVQGTVWNFYSNKYNENIDKSTPMTDTVIKGVHYKRFFWKEIEPEKGDTVGTTVGYLNCAKKTMFQYCKNFSEKQGCPVVMLECADEAVSKKRKTTLRFELQFLADTLTPQELKVFNAWENFAKKNPIASSDKWVRPD